MAHDFIVFAYVKFVNHCHYTTSACWKHVPSMREKVTRGRPRTECMTNIKEWTGMRYEDLVRLAQGREQWRMMTA